MSLEQVLADHSAALNNLAAAIREQVGAQKQTIISSVEGALNFANGGKLQEAIKGSFALNAHEAPENRQPEVTTSGDIADVVVTLQPITGKSDEVQSIVPDEAKTEVTYDEMRSAFMKVPSKCGADVAREILAKFSCTKVPQVPAEHYAEVKRLSEEALAKAGK